MYGPHTRTSVHHKGSIDSETCVYCEAMVTWLPLVWFCLQVKKQYEEEVCIWVYIHTVVLDTRSYAFSDLRPK